MCGICGFIGKSDNQKEILNKMMDKIKHRGPDSEGMYICDNVAIGFRRLSIIDLDNGTQPMSNEDESIIVTMNGEIYNYKEVREELIKKGHVFKNNSDTECIVHGYEEYGADILKHVRGMFAFTVWDTKKEVFFCARDFFGIKPLYYSVVNNQLIYASEIKSILEHPAYKKEINLDALEAYLMFQYSVLEETFFKGIFKLMPGHYMLYSNGKLEINRYWNPEFKENNSMTYKQAVESVDRIMADSVKYHMVSDVEVGSLLSSGVDSSFVVSRFKGAKTFSVGFRNDNHNELDYAKAFAEHIGVENYRKYIGDAEFFGVVDKVQYYMDEPLADASCVALYIVDELASEKVKVVLSGEGADELFGGYNIYHEPKSLVGFKLIPNGLKRFIKKKLTTSKKDFYGKNYIIRGCTPLEERFIGNAKRFSPAEVKKIMKNHSNGKNNFPYSITKPIYERSKGSEFAKMQYIDINLWLIGDILLKADKMSMAHSLESRVPFLDKEVFNVAKTIPSKYKIHKKVTKYAFRQVANKYIPENVAQKKKLGFPVPIAKWLRMEEYYNKIKAVFESDYAKEFFVTDEIVELLNVHYEKKRDESKKIWTIYVFLLWYDIYFNNKEVELNK